MSVPAVNPLRHARGRRLSEVLTEIANDASREAISFADIRDVMGDRTYGVLLFAFAVPNALPVNPPGVSTVLGMPLLFLAMQMILGLKAPWLPKAFMRRSVRRESFARAMNVAVPWIRRVEKLLKPRLVPLASGWFERVIGLVCAVLALVLTLPIPFGNMPPAVAICILALALLEKDGVAVLAGLAAAAGALFIASGVILGIVKAVSLFLRHLLGA
jgi:hypothetical protein